MVGREFIGFRFEKASYDAFCKLVGREEYTATKRLSVLCRVVWVWMSWFLLIDVCWILRLRCGCLWIGWGRISFFIIVRAARKLMFQVCCFGFWVKFWILGLKVRLRMLWRTRLVPKGDVSWVYRGLLLVLVLRVSLCLRSMLGLMRRVGRRDSLLDDRILCGFVVVLFVVLGIRIVVRWFSRRVFVFWSRGRVCFFHW